MDLRTHYKDSPLMMKACLFIASDLVAFVSGYFTKAERQRITDHVRSCETCFAAIRAMRDAATESHEVEPPADLLGRILARVRDNAEREVGSNSRVTLLNRIRSRLNDGEVQSFDVVRIPSHPRNNLTNESTC